MGAGAQWNTRADRATGGTIAAWAGGKTAVFAAGADAASAFVVAVSGSHTVGGMTVQDESLTISGGTLVLNNGGAVTIDVASGLTGTITSVLTGSDGLVKQGGGTLALSGNNTYAGPTSVEGGTLVFSNSLVSLSSLELADNTLARLEASGVGNRVIKTAAITFNGSARLDLTNNKLIVERAAAGTWNGSAYTGVSGLVDSGRGNASNAQWDGSGIVTTDTRAVNNNDLVSIGVAKVGTIKNIADTATTTFAGQTVLGSDVAAMVTWGGDANLDGKINIDDYGQIDFNVGSSRVSVFGWFNGDFNYDGKINIDDYGIIDFNVTAQNSIFPTGGGIEGVAAVPEPAGGLILLGLAAAVPGRRRRSARSARRF